jgi:hypothetical protein
VKLRGSEILPNARHTGCASLPLTVQFAKRTSTKFTRRDAEAERIESAAASGRTVEAEHERALGEIDSLDFERLAFPELEFDRIDAAPVSVRCAQSVEYQTFAAFRSHSV